MGIFNQVVLVGLGFLKKFIMDFCPFKSSALTLDFLLAAPSVFVLFGAVAMMGSSLSGLGGIKERAAQILSIASSENAIDIMSMMKVRAS